MFCSSPGWWDSNVTGHEEQQHQVCFVCTCCSGNSTGEMQHQVLQKSVNVMVLCDIRLMKQCAFDVLLRMYTPFRAVQFCFFLIFSFSGMIFSVYFSLLRTLPLFSSPCRPLGKSRSQFALTFCPQGVCCGTPLLLMAIKVNNFFLFLRCLTSVVPPLHLSCLYPHCCLRTYLKISR